MSLGPPFDASGRGLQRAAGAATVLLLAGAIAFVLFGAGRTFGSGVILHVRMASTGALKTGARVMLAGRTVGEVRAFRMGKDALPPPLPGTPAPPPRRGVALERGVVVDIFVARAFVPSIDKRSELFVATPSILGEAYLEVGPVRGARAGTPVDGDELRGTDPPEIDRFLEYGEASVREVLALLREARPELDEFLVAFDALLARVSGITGDGGQLRRIRAQAEEGLARGAELLAALRDSNAVDRTKKLVKSLGELADRAAPELRDLGKKLDRAIAKGEELAALYDGRKGDLEHVLAAVRHAAKLGDRVIQDVRALQARVARGDGTLGAFLLDREIFDDLHETHRIIKSAPLRLLLKSNVNTNVPRKPKP